MCVKLNSLFDSKVKVYYVTQVLKQGIYIKTIWHKLITNNYILKFRNTKIAFVVYLGVWVKIGIVIENHVC